MKIKRIKDFWSGRKKDFTRLYRHIGEMETSHFDPKRKHLNDLENEIIQLRKKVAAKKRQFQKVSQQQPNIWNRFKIPNNEKRLYAIRKSIAQLRSKQEQKQQDYTVKLKLYNDMVRVVSDKLQHQPSPEFSPVSEPQKTASFVRRDRLGAKNGLSM